MNEATHRKPLFRDRHSFGSQYGFCYYTGLSFHTISNILLNHIYRVLSFSLSICQFGSIHMTVAYLFSVLPRKLKQFFRSRTDMTRAGSCAASRQFQLQAIFQTAALGCRLVLTYLIPIILIVPLCGCGSLTKPLPGEPKALAVASCPKLTPLQSDAFGAVSSKLAEVSGVYYTCRASVGIKD